MEIAKKKRKRERIELNWCWWFAARSTAHININKKCINGFCLVVFHFVQLMAMAMAIEIFDFEGLN